MRYEIEGEILREEEYSRDGAGEEGAGGGPTRTRYVLKCHKGTCYLVI